MSFRSDIFIWAYRSKEQYTCDPLLFIKERQNTMSKMTPSKLTLTAAMLGALSMLTTAALTTASASAKEKCFGIAKAGENDCSNDAGLHNCAGLSSLNYHGTDWQYVEAGTCATLAGSLASFEGANPEKSDTGPAQPPKASQY